MKLMPLGLACLTSLLISSSAHAQMAKPFKAMDRNGDGYIDASELTARRLANFDRADTNHDGALSHEEVDAARAARPRNGPGADRDGFGLADRDGDGLIERSDVENTRPFLIEAADKDGDKRLSRKELRKYMMELREKRQNQTK